MAGDAVPGRGAVPDGQLPVDATLRRVTVIFRLLGWAWMLLVAVITLFSDDEADAAVVVGAIVVATLWTAGTVVAARSHERLSADGYVIADGVVAVFILMSSNLAGADNFFHGGYPMSWLGVAAYAWGFRGAVTGSVFLAVEQGIAEYLADKGAVPIAGSVTFIVFAAVAGWGYSALRRSDRSRLEARAKLAAEQRARARFEERAGLANRLHDSVLQTLIAIRREAEDGRQVRYLARRQERELRETIDEYRSPFPHSLRAALLRHCGEVEDLYKVEIDAVIRGDADADGRFRVVAVATREALINAAKHSGRLDIDLYADLSSEDVEVFVRDRGRGFDADGEVRRGLDHSLVEPVRDAGGWVGIDSSSGTGTEVVIRMGMGDG